jgi:hypothetical protein
MASEKKDQSPPPYTANDGNIAENKPGPDADLHMVPAFMGMSGQGNNQSTDRPKGSV